MTEPMAGTGGRRGASGGPRAASGGPPADPLQAGCAGPVASVGGKSLAVRNLTAGYGRVQVLHGIDLDVRQGEVLGIGGPNGAGKTTLLYAIAGLNATCKAEITIGGSRVDKLHPHQRVRRGLALVPEGRQVIGSLSVRANLDVTVMVRGRWRRDDEHRRRLERVATLFPQLADRWDVPSGALSGGEQQMLAIGRALMTNPEVMMLDEPSQGLAPQVVDCLVQSLGELKGTVTLVIVEHDERLLGALADRRVALKFGRLVT